MAVRKSPYAVGKRAEEFIKDTPDRKAAAPKPVIEKVAVGFKPEELAELDALAAALGNLPRTSCIRLALKRLAQIELG